MRRMLRWHNRVPVLQGVTNDEYQVIVDLLCHLLTASIKRSPVASVEGVRPILSLQTASVPSLK